MRAVANRTKWVQNRSEQQRGDCGDRQRHRESGRALHHGVGIEVCHAAFYNLRSGGRIRSGPNPEASFVLDFSANAVAADTVSRVLSRPRVIAGIVEPACVSVYVVALLVKHGLGGNCALVVGALFFILVGGALQIANKGGYGGCRRQLHGQVVPTAVLVEGTRPRNIGRIGGGCLGY